MKQVAFLTMDCLDDFVCYDHLAIEPLRQRNCQVSFVSWTAENVVWDQFDLVVIRSPWDYQQRWPQFLQVLETIDDSAAVLENRLDIVRWNINKRYLQDLQTEGVSIVPTEWRERISEADLQQLLHAAGPHEIVVKPLIGAGADRTWRLSCASESGVLHDVLTTYANQPVMVQPFQQSIIAGGEYSLFYFATEYSHCVLKKPKAGDFRVQEEHGGLLRSVIPAADLKAAAQAALAAAPGDTLYARVDLVRLDCGVPAVMELELIEPSLYFPFDSQAPVRFADAIASRLVRNR